MLLPQETRVDERREFASMETVVHGEMDRFKRHQEGRKDSRECGENLSGENRGAFSKKKVARRRKLTVTAPSPMLGRKRREDVLRIMRKNSFRGLKVNNGLKLLRKRK